MPEQRFKRFFIIKKLKCSNRETGRYKQHKLLNAVTSCLLCSLALLSVGCVKYEIQGTVTSCDGTAYPDMEVTILRNSQDFGTVTTDTLGYYSYELSGPGEYQASITMGEGQLSLGSYIMPKLDLIETGGNENITANFYVLDENKAWREEIEVSSNPKVTLPVLHLEGSHYEIGCQHGALARKEIRSYRKAAYAYLDDFIKGEIGNINTDYAIDILINKWKPFLEENYPDYIEEFQGLADSTGISLNHVITPSVAWELYALNGLDHCSEFTAMGEATVDGKMYHGFNLDMYPDALRSIWMDHAQIQIVKPDNKQSFVMPSTAGAVGAYTGINYQQISIAWDNDASAFDPDYGQGPLGPLLNGQPFAPFTLLIRSALENASSIDEAVTFMASAYRPLGDITIITDGKSGQAKVLEAFNNPYAVANYGQGYALREPSQGALWSANYFQTLYVNPPYDPRQEQYEELLIGANKVTPIADENAAINAVLRYSQICNSGNEMSVLYVPEDMKMWVSTKDLTDDNVVDTPCHSGVYVGFDIENNSALPQSDWIVPPS